MNSLDLKHTVPCVFANDLGEELDVEAVFYIAKDDQTFCPGYVKQGNRFLFDAELPPDFWDVVKASYYFQHNLTPCFINL